MEILSSLDELGFLTTSQIQRLHNLGGRRNTLRILQDMKDYLQSYRLDEMVYYLSDAGRKEVGSRHVRRRSHNVQHALIRNEVYIHTKPSFWRSETPVKWQGKEIVPDAFYKTNNYVFLEVDITQLMHVNKEKIDKYKDLKNSGLFQKQFGEFPIIQFVTCSDSRKQKLRGMLDGMKAEVITYQEMR